MCKTRKIIVTNRICLGDRVICYEAYSLPKGEVVEITEAQLRRLIMNGPDEIYGLRISEKTKELEFDPDYFTTNMMDKVHTGILKPMVEGETVANIFYIVIGTKKSKNETLYEVISSRYERTTFTAEKVKTLLDLNIITGGAKLENGEIVVAPLEKPVKEEVQQAPAPTITINGEEVA